MGAHRLYNRSSGFLSHIQLGMYYKLTCALPTFQTITDIVNCVYMYPCTHTIITSLHTCMDTVTIVAIVTCLLTKIIFMPTQARYGRDRVVLMARCSRYNIM